jgi:ABC-2 type transport system permease protein
MQLLIRNEMIKVWKKRRFFVIVGILLVLIPIFVYAQMRISANVERQLGDTDWKAKTQQEILRYNERLSSPGILEEWKRTLQVQVQILQYYVDNDVNPNEPNGVTFTREFMRNAIGLFIPLMVLVIASDLVSSEHAGGTIKLLLTRPTSRWKVLLSKYIAMMLYVSLIVATIAFLCYAISGAVFGYGGWQTPTLTGFQITDNEVSFANVHLIEHWLFIWMELGLVWFSSLVVGAIALMVSVLVRSTAAGMGIMLATIIAGSILAAMASSWESAKYFFMLNLDTVGYLAGSPPAIPGMDLAFSITILSIWALASIIVSFGVFTRQDIY